MSRDRISPAEIDRLKREDDFLARVERLVPGLRPASGDEKRGPCPSPNCGASSAFHVIPRKNFAHCFACGGAWDPVQWIMDFDGLSFLEAVAQLGGEVARGIDPEAERRHRAEERKRRAAEEKKRRERAEYAHKIWRAAAPIAGTPAERYLVGRGLSPPFPDTLRFVERLPAKWIERTGDQTRERSGKFPALVAGVQTPRGGFQTIHRIYLEETASGDVVKNRTMPPDSVKKLHGSPGAGAVRLSFSKSDRTLALAEGIETALAVRQSLLAHGLDCACWAAISAGQLLRIAFGDWRPERIFIFADNDQSGTGAAKAAAAAARFRDELGIPAAWRMPDRVGVDWLDLMLPRY